jgi:6-phosphogluconate dehydrogenase
MQIGMIGLGKMGGNMAERLRRAGHDVVGYDRDPKASDVGSLQELIERLQPPRVVWVMVPAGDPTRATIEELGKLLSPGDIVVDGGNSHYLDDQKHAKELAA